MDARAGLTVMVFVTIQPSPKEYDMVAVPEVIPVTIPDNEPTAATEELLLVQTPPETELLSIIVVPTQTEDGPVIAPGAELTVTVAVAMQPVGSV